MVVISVDGLASYAVTKQVMPRLVTLLTDGAGTLNARTAERTVTLPNHTSMVTGLPIASSAGGHGVTWNVDLPERTVPSSVRSIFTLLADRGLTSAVFAGKSKLRLWDRSWPGTITRFVVDGSPDRLLAKTLTDLRRKNRSLTFLHLAGPDVAGHSTGWASASYERALRAADEAIGAIADAVSTEDSAVLVVTADHGGVPGTRTHGDFTDPANYTIPFVVWGSGIARGDLYRLDTDLVDPGNRSTAEEVNSAVSNAMVANLVAGAVGLPPVRGSHADQDQSLAESLGLLS